MQGPLYFLVNELHLAERQADLAYAENRPLVGEAFARQYHKAAQEILEQTGLDPRWQCPDRPPRWVDCPEHGPQEVRFLGATSVTLACGRQGCNEDGWDHV